MKYSFVFGKLGRDSVSSNDNDAATTAGAPASSSNLDTLRSTGAVSTAETADMHADFVCTERFADNFWSEDGRCVSVLTTKLKNAKQSCLDLLTMISKRAEIEEELGKKVLKLSRSALGCEEVGTIKDAFRCVRVEMENTAKTHLDLAKQLRAELEKPFLGFMDDQKRKRRAQTSVIQKTEEERSQLRGMIRKLQDKRRNDTRKVGDLELQVNGLHGMGDPKLRNKLERAQAQQRATEKEYVDVRQRLHDADQQWYHVWRSACDVFQVLEEQRISYLKHIVWTFTNLVSSSFVTDDESMEKIRQDLERIDVASDILAFIRTFGTGGPDPELEPEGARARTEKVTPGATAIDSHSQSTMHGTANSSMPAPEGAKPIHRTSTSNSQDHAHTDNTSGTMNGSMQQQQQQQQQQPISRPSTQQRVDSRQQQGPPLPARNSSRPTSMYAQGVQPLAGTSAAEAAWNDRPRSSMQQGSSVNGASAAHYRRSSNTEMFNSVSSQQQQQPSQQQQPQKQSPQHPSPQQRHNPAMATRQAEALYGGTVNGMYGGAPVIDPRAGSSAGMYRTGTASPAPIMAQRPGTPGQMGEVSGSYSSVGYAPQFYPGQGNGQPPRMGSPRLRANTFNGAMAPQTGQFGTLTVNTQIPTTQQQQQQQPAYAIPLQHPNSAPNSPYQQNGAPSSYNGIPMMANGHVANMVSPQPGSRPVSVMQSPQYVYRAATPVQQSPQFIPANMVSRPPTQMSHSPHQQYQQQHLHQRTPSVMSAYPVAHQQVPMQQTQQQQQQQQPVQGESNLTSDQREIISYVKAMYDYDAENSRELSIREGDIISVLQVNPDGWWEGELTDSNTGQSRRGVFPSNFVDPISNLTAT